MISEFKMLIHVIISQAYNVTLSTVYTCGALPVRGGSGYVRQSLSCQTGPYNERSVSHVPLTRSVFNPGLCYLDNDFIILVKTNDRASCLTTESPIINTLNMYTFFEVKWICWIMAGNALHGVKSFESINLWVNVLNNVIL